MQSVLLTELSRTVQMRVGCECMMCIVDWVAAEMSMWPDPTVLDAKSWIFPKYSIDILQLFLNLCSEIEVLEIWRARYTRSA